jgi:hypothetical protein
LKVGLIPFISFTRQILFPFLLQSREILSNPMTLTTPPGVASLKNIQNQIYYAVIAIIKIEFYLSKIEFWSESRITNLSG